MSKIFLVGILLVAGAVSAQNEEAPQKFPGQPVFFGEFRYRQQEETQQPKETRRMQRFQARFGFNTQVEENLQFTFRLMTGSSASSGNQTAGDEKAPGMPRRSIGLDQAFIDYKALEVWNLYLGKMPPPFTFAGKNQMLLDRDMTLEGVGTKVTIPTTNSLNIFVQGGSFWIRENYDSAFGDDQTDNMFNAGQLGLQWKPADWTVAAGLGSFAFISLRDSPPTNLTAGGGANGNTLDINGNYPTNFDIQQVFLEVKKKFGSFDTAVFAETLVNEDAKTLNKAKAFGLQTGYKNWSFAWVEQEVQKDAVVGLFTDSDFGGGQTSSKGTMMSLGYKFTKQVQAQYTIQKSKNAIDSFPQKYDRTHIDLTVSF
ncbi:MAG: putative porin [Pseudobdellovibrionaceae bacterium]